MPATRDRGGGGHPPHAAPAGPLRPRTAPRRLLLLAASMSSACTWCGDSRRLRPIWAHEHVQRFTSGAKTYDFCESCETQLERCRYCGDAVGISAAMAKGDQQLQLFEACHDPHKSCYMLEWQRRSPRCRTGCDPECWHLIDAEQEAADYAGDEYHQTCDDREYSFCVDCDVGLDFTRGESITWHGDGHDYCIDCYRSYGP